MATVLFSVALPADDGSLHTVNVIKRPFDECIGRTRQFTGQKIHHPFGTDANHKYTGWLDGMEDFFKNAIFDVKHDGACGAFVCRNGEWQPFTRFDVKKNKAGVFETGKIQDDWFPCEDMPTDESATHWPHFRPCDPKKDKWQLLAFENAKPYLPTHLSAQSSQLMITGEYMGRKFNNKSADPLEVDAAFIPHGLIGLEIPPAVRTFEGIRRILQAIPTMEGIVVYCPTACFKIRRENFQGLTWPAEGPEALAKYGFEGGLSKRGLPGYWREVPEE